MTGRNEVRGKPGWHYGIFVRGADRTLTFAVYGPEGQVIEGLQASAYRTTTLARSMGDKRRGYEHVATLAIREQNLRRRLAQLRDDEE